MTNGLGQVVQLDSKGLIFIANGNPDPNQNPSIVTDLQNNILMLHAGQVKSKGGVFDPDDITTKD